MLLTFAPFCISFLISLTLMLGLRPVAKQLGLIDVPGGRKMHSGDVPVIGGLAMLGATLAAVLAMGVSGAGEAAMLVAAALMVLVGALDDRFDLAPYVRILAHVAAAVTLVMASGLTVESFGDLLGMGQISLGPLDFIFTTVATIALINGFNMLDGLDGLAGGVALVALAGLSYYFFDGTGHGAALVVSLSLLGAVLGFMVFNLPARYNRSLLAFMGDSGSTLLGFALAGLSLIAIQPTGEGLPPVVILWLMPVPIIELFTSTFRRAMTGLSPMQADRGHFHHRLLDAGFAVRAIFLIYLFVSVVSAVIGIVAWQLGVGESVMFYAFVFLSAVWLLATRNAHTLVRLLPGTLRRADRRRQRSVA